MPKIPQYSAEIDPISTINAREAQPSPIGQSIANFGAGVEKLGQGVNTVQGRIETGNAATALSNLQIDALSKIKDMKAPASPEDITKFMTENWDTPAANAQDGIGTSIGSEFFEKQNRYARDLIYNHLLAQNAQLQQQQFGQKINEFDQNMKTLAFSHGDDSTWNSVVGQVNDGIVGANPSGAAVGQAKIGEILRGAAINRFDGLIERGNIDGDGGAQELLDSHKMDQYLNYGSPNTTSDQSFIQNKINAARHGQLIDQQRAITQLKTAQAAANADTENMFAKMLYAPKEAGAQLTSKTILNSNLPWGMKQTWLNNLQKASVPLGDSTDPATYNRLREQIDSGEISNIDQLRKYSDDNTLSTKDYAKLQNEMILAGNPAGRTEAKNYQALVDQAKQFLSTNNFGGKDQGADENLYAFEHELADTYQKLKGPPNNYTSDQLLNPVGPDGKANPNYLGNLAQKYKARWSPILERFLAEHHVPSPVPVDSVPRVLGVQLPQMTGGRPTIGGGATPTAAPTPAVAAPNTPLNVPLPPEEPQNASRGQTVKTTMSSAQFPEGMTGTTKDGRKVIRKNGAWVEVK